MPDNEFCYAIHPLFLPKHPYQSPPLPWAHPPSNPALLAMSNLCAFDFDLAEKFIAITSVLHFGCLPKPKPNPPNLANFAAHEPNNKKQDTHLYSLRRVPYNNSNSRTIQWIVVLNQIISGIGTTRHGTGARSAAITVILIEFCFVVIFHRLCQRNNYRSSPICRICR